MARTEDAFDRVGEVVREHIALCVEETLLKPTRLERLGGRFEPPTRWQRVRYK